MKNMQKAKKNEITANITLFFYFYKSFITYKWGQVYLSHKISIRSNNITYEPMWILGGENFCFFLNAKFLGSLCEDKKNSIYQLIKQSKCYIHSTVHGTLQD